MIDPLGTTTVCSTFWPNSTNSESQMINKNVMIHLIYTWWIFVLNFIAIHPIVDEILQSGPKWWIDWPTLPSLAKKSAEHKKPVHTTVVGEDEQEERKAAQEPVMVKSLLGPACGCSDSDLSSALPQSRAQSQKCLVISRRSWCTETATL